MDLKRKIVLLRAGDCGRAMLCISGGLASMVNRILLLTVSSSVLFVTASQAQPNKPNLKTATGGGKQVQLEWEPVPGATSYNIYWSTTASVTPANAQAHASNPGRAYTVPSLTNGTAYYFVVTAVNAAGESATSNELSATPTATAMTPATTSTAAVQPTTNVGQSTDSNIQTPTMTFAVFTPATYPVLAAVADTPNGKITYDASGVEALIQGACTPAFKSNADFAAAFNDGQTYTLINVINLKGEADAQNVASNNWYIFSKGKTFTTGFAGGWQLANFDGATRLYGAKKVLLLSILENNRTPAGKDSPSIAYTVTVTKAQPTNVANVVQLLGLVFPAKPAAAVPSTPASYWACNAVPIAYKTSKIKLDLSYTAGGGSPFTASQSFTSEASRFVSLSRRSSQQQV